MPSPCSLIDDLFSQCADLPVLGLERLEPAIPTLREVFAQLTDGRARCGRRYRLATVLSIALLAVLCGARSIRAVHRVEVAGELAGTVTDHELEPVRALAEVHHPVPGSLGGPLTIRVRAHPGQVHTPRTVLDQDQSVDLLSSTVSAWTKSSARIP